MVFGGGIQKSTAEPRSRDFRELEHLEKRVGRRGTASDTESGGDERISAGASVCGHDTVRQRTRQVFPVQGNHVTQRLCRTNCSCAALSETAVSARSALRMNIVEDVDVFVVAGACPQPTVTMSERACNNCSC